MSDGELFMLRAEFDQPALMRFAHRNGFDLRFTDGGYILHAALGALFGDAAPRPFVARGARSRRLTLLGYASHDHRELGDRARALADPLVADAVDLASLCSKPMPATWRAGALYRFEARVCPLVRISGRSSHEDSREVDAFIHQCLRVGAETLVDRQEVYRGWLAGELGRAGAAQMREARLLRFRDRQS
jgi:CRISPR system Cascade subunit CasE